MKCCANCFGDFEIKGFISSSSDQIGDCDFCSSANVDIIDCNELYYLLQPLLSIYRPAVDTDLQLESCRDLSSILQEDWPLVFRLTKEKLSEFLAEVLSTNHEQLISGLVVPCYEDDRTQEESWERFVEELKTVNRFFITNSVDTNLLQGLLKQLEKEYKRHKTFYRARISESTKLDASLMGKPPHTKATAGRANPRGIPYLYLSNDIDTTLYETRASLLDYVTIGRFVAIEDIRVINLRDDKMPSPISLEDSLEKYMSHRRYLSRLGQELSKPVRKYDSELDYLPTQYLCEFVKSLGYDGVEYRSSLNPDGFNLAIFNDEKFKCVDTDLYEVKSIKYNTKKLKPL
jgi:hypothetical protein